MRELVRLGGRGLVLGAALFAMTLTAPTSVEASKPPVSLGKVTARVPQAAAVKRELESAVKSEFGRVDLSNVRGRDRFVLSTALVKMDTVTDSDQVETSCVVSATLTRAGSGALYAVLQGRARATDSKDATKENELAALRAAVRSAIGRVPEALR